MSKLETYLVTFLAGVFVLLAAFAGGVYYEHEKFAAYKNEQKGIAETQARNTKLADEKNIGDANDAQKSYVQAINGIDAYYRDHPVIRTNGANVGRVCGTGNGSGTVSGSAENTQVTDGTGTGLYASPYNPSDTEKVAERLDALQQRLLQGAEHGEVQID